MHPGKLRWTAQLLLVAAVPLSFHLLCCPCLAGTNGILEGTVRDKRTGEPLAGASVFLPELQTGTSTDPGGHYEIQNIRAGTYDVRFSLVGYQARVVKGLAINPDLRTRLTVGLEPSDFQLDEVVVTQERPLIQKDVTGTTYIMSGEEIRLLPLDNVSDVIRLKPGVTLEGNVRGGKATEVSYLIDGLPVRDLLAGEMTTTIPKSSVVGMSIYTGGFEAEYGNALSGIVNIVTKTATERQMFFARGEKDDLFGGTQVSKTNVFEVSGSGPIVGKSLSYTASFEGYYTDTRWWQDFQQYFGSPVDKTLSGFGKLDFAPSTAFRIGGQVLISHRAWRDYEFSWRFNLPGLPPEQRTAARIALIASHTVSDNFFYTASLSRYSLTSHIGDEAKETVPVNDPYQYDFYLRWIVSGQRAWWIRSTQEAYTAKFDGTLRLGSLHLMKVGGELNLHNLKSDIVKFEPRMTYFGKPIVYEPQLDFSSSYAYRPSSGSVYVQDKVDLSDEGMLVNFGLRYDFLNPTARRPAIEAVVQGDTSVAFSTGGWVPATVKQQFSPRLGFAMQVAEKGYLFVNLGWYFQYPLFDYLYSGLDRVALGKGVSALTGNPDLNPERTLSWEMSLKYSFPQNLVGSLTYFRKETTNLVDTKTFIPGDSKLAGNYGFAEYVNSPFAEASGFELVLTRDRGEWLTGELSYTYMTAVGTSGSAQDGFYIAQYGLPPGVREYPLSWDQRGTLKALVTVTTPLDLNLTLVYEWHSGRPYTAYSTSTGFEPVNGGLFIENNARMPAYSNLDMRVDKLFRFGWWPNAALTLFVDIRNVANDRNVKWVDSNGRIGGELDDPSGYFPARRTHVGIQIAF